MIFMLLIVLVFCPALAAVGVCLRPARSSVLFIHIPVAVGEHLATFTSVPTHLFRAILRSLVDAYLMAVPAQRLIGGKRAVLTREFPAVALNVIY